MKQLQGLLAFVEAASAGSLAAAADRLELTPAAVSKSLGKLEAQLGVRLLQRSTRRLALTAEGERFLDKARHALRALDEAVADVTQSATEASGRVRISVGHAMGRDWVLPLLPALSQAHPGLMIELDLDNRPVDLVAEGYDIGIRGGFVEDSSLVARRICGLPLALLASPGYLRRAGVPRTIDELRTHECVAVRFAGSAPSPWRFRSTSGGRGARRIEIQPQPRLAVSDPAAVLDLALAGAGIVQAGLHHALPFLRSGRLKLLMVDQHDPGEREVVLHYPHRRYLAPRVRVVVDTLLAQLGPPSDLHMTVQDLLAEVPGAEATASGAESTPAHPALRRKTKRSDSDTSASKA
ncbi:MAG TPA: LysR substrate-binding domain-containing protein [Ideonella sp.]|uniref:LysR family transcriptional regulator n=1 Tax=Ideonella sp. TaxID=1929293 RepID=UPI002E33EABE|nr:LysR substrate-binding domain-containing protein [Ideonella sp.]HEX5686812.1 LysR substrate-binding domain-containing protein [Ideonella sp.]